MDNQIIYFCELIKNVIHPQKDSSLKGTIEWSTLVQLAKEHNLLPIFMEGAIKQYSYIVRQEYDREMSEAIAVVAAQVKRTNAFLKLYDAFVREGLHPIVMKGLICRELYGDLSDHRPSGDEDILIRLNEYWKAKEVLIANGYVPGIESETEAQLEKLQEVSFIHPKEKLHIELHLNAMGKEDEARSRMSEYFERVFDNYREVEVNGVQVRTMNHQDHLTLLILHTFKHFIGGGFGIRQMLDILLYQEKYCSEIVIAQLRDVLHTFKADVFWNDMINIGNKYFGFELPVFQEPNCLDELLEDMILCGTFGNKTQAERTATGTVLAATENYLQNKANNSLKMLWKSVFPNKTYLVNQYSFLEKRPWLLPVVWAKRLGRFLKKHKMDQGNLAFESMKISQRRMKLLKKYGLV